MTSPCFLSDQHWVCQYLWPAVAREGSFLRECSGDQGLGVLGIGEAGDGCCVTGEIGVACGSLHSVAVRGAAVRQDQGPDSCHVRVQITSF